MLASKPKPIGLLLAACLLSWLLILGYQAVQLNLAPPMDERDKSEPSIGQIIQPLVHKAHNQTLIFEDVLPDTISQKETPISSNENRHQLSLIIDDVGYDIKAMRRLIELPFPFTVSILPDSPYAKQADQMAYQHGIPVMLHMPMETTNPKYKNKMENFYLHTAMSKPVFTQVFEEALAKVPHAVGINNHMGSALTADKKSMVWLMELCKKHGLFFIDSRTSSKSVGAQEAKRARIAWNQRDIFLDHVITEDGLQHAWESALSCIKKNDYCIMLGHPHYETLDFLENKTHALRSNDFVSIQDVLNQ
ncbi:MAG: divergent polysaccharide deacetylase family protein [Ghiorsea sp.]